MPKLNQKFNLFLFILISSSFVLNEEFSDKEPISELYQKMYTTYMKGVISNLSTGKQEFDDSSTEYIELNKEGENSFIISPKITYIFQLNPNTYIYAFKSPVDDIIHYQNLINCSRFCVVQGNNQLMYVNYYKNIDKEINLKVLTKKGSLTVESYKLDSPRFSQIFFMPSTTLFVFQLTANNYMYIDSFDRSSKFYYAEYDENITPNDIIDLNPKYFMQGLEKLINLEKDKIYIGFFPKNVGFCKIYMYNSLPEKIKIKDADKEILFLEKNKKYILDFSENNMRFIIRLNPKTDAKIKMKDISGNIKELSSNDKYFYPSSHNENIEVDTENDALIEILHSFENSTDLIDGTNVNDYVITENILTLVEYKKDNDKNYIKIHIKSNEGFGIGTYGGLSKDKYIYYSKEYIPKYSYNIYDYTISLYDPLNNALLEKDEKYYIALFFKKSNENQELKLSINYIKNPIEFLYEDIDEKYINNVISNLTSLIKEIYIYLDIVKNPPEPEGLQNYVHPKRDMIKALNNIDRKNRKFYDVYREIREILGTPRDMHFRIWGETTPKGVKFNYITACLPFSIYVDKTNSDSEPKLYIKYYQDCGIFFSDKIKNSIKEKEEKKIPLIEINDKNSFDYIQNWGREYKGNKSPHAHFSYIKRIIFSFYLKLYPYTPEELHMKFKFGNNDILDLDYYIYIPNLQSMQKLLGSAEKFNQDDFDKFVEEDRKKHLNEIYEPNIFDLIKKFKKEKGLLKDNLLEQNSKIDWDFRTPEENGIRCKVDKKHEINILVQETFSLDTDKALNVVYQCAKAFYNNTYKVVVIQSRNGGGSGELAIVMRQILQVQIKNRAYLAYKPMTKIKSEYDNYPDNIFDVETCKPFKTWEEYATGNDVDYSTQTETIIHKKTKIVDILTKNMRKMLEEVREEILQLNKKKPTDIIIFTDSYSYSATCIFIKAFQNEGGAITVGFNGNPYLSKDLFDASQSPAPVSTFDMYEEYKSLKNLGFNADGITFGETYEDDYIIEKPIPREYKLDTVDEIVDIYEPYTDDNYEIFINKAKEVFKKYNEDGKCNPKNNKLVLDKNDNKCNTFQDDKYAHGGYACGADGNWNFTCKKYYCDLGYYYNQYKGKCEIDYCTNDPGEKYIILRDKYEETIILNSSNNYEYVFKIDTSNYIYFFEANETGYIHYGVKDPCPKLCVLQMNIGIHHNEVHLNYFRNAKNNVEIKIHSYPIFNGMIISLVLDNFFNEAFLQTPDKYIMIVEFTDDYVFYTKTFEDSHDIYYAEYNKEMSISNIIDINKNYYKLCTNKVIEGLKGKNYIVAIETKIVGKLLELFVKPKLLEKITISQETNNMFLYLTNQIKEYTINYQNNKFDSILRLSKESKDTEITVKNSETGVESKINSVNSYYTFNGANGIFKGQLTMKMNKGENSLIEILFAIDQNNYEILTEKEFSEHKLSKPAIIKFDNNKKNKMLQIELYSKSNQKFGYWSITGYSKNKYINTPTEDLPKIEGSSSYKLSINNKDENLEEGESFYLLIFVNRNILSDETYQIMISKKEEKDTTDNIHSDSPTDENQGLPPWAIALIVIGSILVLGLIIFLVIKVIKSKGKSNPDNIGPLVENNDLKEMNENI